MTAKKFIPLILILALVGMSLTACSQEAAEAQSSTVSTADLISGAPQDVPIPGTVTLVDIGAHSCIPCKMMTPIIEELSREYEGRAAIVFIDIWEHKDERDKFGIKSIPTQIFYDADGKERYRHVGFLSKKRIVAKLAELGVK